jgi:preprotein translocase subunit SecE
MSKITDFFKEVRIEFKHINWPSRKQAISYTVAVVGISLVVAALLGFFDFIFTAGLTKLLAK